MAKTRSLEVVISGDPKQLNRAFGSIDRSAAGTEGRLKRMGKVGALAFGGLAAAAAGAAVIGLKKSADAAIEAEKAQARMTAQLKASGISYRAHAKEIDAVIQRTSKLAGIDDEDLQDAFTNIVRSTGSVDKGLRNIGLAADIARAKHIDVAKAGQLVGRVATGNVTALSRYGIQIDKNATSSEALAELQKRFSGQAEAYGKTTAGSMERAGVAAENLGEAVGAKLAPFVAKGADALTDLIDRSGQAAGPIRTVTGTIANAYNSVRNAVTRFARTNREDIASVVNAVKNLGRFFRSVFEDIILPAVRAALPGIRQALNGIITVLRGIVRVITGIINGDWKRAWDGLKDIVRGAVGALAGIIRGVGGLVLTAGKAIGKKAVDGLTSAFSNLGHTILGKITGAWDWVKSHLHLPKLKLPSIDIPFVGSGDGIGKTPGGLPSIPNLTGVGASGSLDGADRALAPFARIASGFGLRVSPGGGGKRPPGTRTSSQGISWHSTGEAIDLSNGRGPDPQKMGFFRAMKSRFGSRLAELIYTPGGVGVKNGRPFTYTGQVAADHFDHVHLAMDLGRPGLGIGDGPGRSLSGINLAIDAARKAGFTGEDLVRMVAIAGRESNYNPRVQNLVYPDHSIGLWQINQLAHHGRYGSDAQLKDPYVNARAAWAISGHGQNFNPWSTNRGLSSSLIDRARRAVAAFSGGSGASSGTSTSGGSAATGTTGDGGNTKAEPERDTTSTYDLMIAASDVQLAGAEGTKGTADDLQAKIARRGLISARIRKVKNALKKRGLKPATRLRLTQELAGLRGEHNTLQTEIGELRHPSATGDTDTAGAGGGQDNQALIDAIAANTQAQQEAAQAFAAHQQELAGVRAEMKRQTDVATSVQATEGFQLKKMLADVVSGQIGGWGVAPRRFTPGTGVEVAF